MLLREMAPDEIESIFQKGFKEWAKGRTYEQYVKENLKEDDYGTRYVYVDRNNNIVGSLIVLTLHIQQMDPPLPLFGIGSVVIDEDHRGKGLGKRMLNECLSHIEQRVQNPIFMLYSDITPDYYHPLHFKELPLNLQRYPKSICMVRCSPDAYQSLCKLPIIFIPAYF